MDEAFARWLELQRQRKQLEPGSPEHVAASEAQYLLEDALRYDYQKLLFWNRAERCWQLVDAE